MSRRLKELEKERAERRKVRRRTKAAAPSSSTAATATATATTDATTAAPNNADGEDTPMADATATVELEDEGTIRERERKELEEKRRVFERREGTTHWPVSLGSFYCSDW